MADATYSLTRRKGIPVIIVQVEGGSFNPLSGQGEEKNAVTTIRLVVKEPTSYGRLIRAKTTQTEVGEATFIFWLGDSGVPKRLEPEDYLIVEGVKFQVVTSSREATSLIITGRETVGEGSDPLISVSPI